MLCAKLGQYIFLSLYSKKKTGIHTQTSIYKPSHTSYIYKFYFVGVLEPNALKNRNTFKQINKFLF